MEEFNKLPAQIQKVIIDRGFDTEEKRRVSLYKDIKEVFENLDHEDFDKAIAILKNKPELVIYGDYDCDGVCARAIMTECLEYLGVTVHDYTN